MYNKNNKKKNVAFTAKTSDIGEEFDEYQREEITLKNRGVKHILRQRRQILQQEFNNNEFKRNDDPCYYCGKLGHIKQNCQKRKKRNN